jgi:hypothetical protein
LSPVSCAAKKERDFATEALEVAKKQANELEAELVTVKELLVLERGRAEGLRETVDTAVNEKDPAREVGEREIQRMRRLPPTN